MADRKPYIVHKAVELSKVNKKRRDELSVPGYLESNFIAQPKHDGCNLILEVREERIYAWSRTGEEVKSVDHIKAAWDMLPFGGEGVYLCEAWNPDLDFPTISGLFRKQETNENTVALRAVIFDYLTLEEWDNGHSPLGYAARVERLHPMMHALDPQGGSPFFTIRGFGKMRDPNGANWYAAEAQDIANKLVAAGGYDGLILRDPDATWTKGHNGSDGAIIKVKPHVSVTYQVTNFLSSKGEKTGRTVYRLVVADKNGREHTIGSGVPHRADLLPGIGYRVEIEAMGFTADGELREPRYKGIRTDVVELD